jgi:quercetin dioxygenase-like cupin family protein
MLEVVIPQETAAERVGTHESMIGSTAVLNMTSQLGVEDLKPIAVYFDAGARTRPHIHPIHDQVLYFISGTGVVAVDGEPDVLVPAGGLVCLPKGHIHMHGASGDGPAAHLSLVLDVDLSFDADVPESWHRFANLRTGC